MADVTARPMPAFARVLARLFAIQASWSYERMQGPGFGHAVEPALRGLPGGPDGEAYRAALARQGAFFNAHPYFAGLAVGAAARAELDGEPTERVVRLRSALGSPLGSLGDRLFWAGWLPACAAIGLLLVALGYRGWGALAFLVLYNAAHVACRVWALRAGWTHGMGVAAALNAPWLRAASRLAAPVAGLCVGVMLPVAFGWQVTGAPAEVVGLAAVGAAAVTLVLRIGAARYGAAGIATVVLGATWLLGFVWR